MYRSCNSGLPEWLTSSGAFQYTSRHCPWVIEDSGHDSGVSLVQLHDIEPELFTFTRVHLFVSGAFFIFATLCLKRDLYIRWNSLIKYLLFIFNWVLNKCSSKSCRFYWLTSSYFSWFWSLGKVHYNFLSSNEARLPGFLPSDVDPNLIRFN